MANGIVAVRSRGDYNQLAGCIPIRPLSWSGFDQGLHFDRMQDRVCSACVEGLYCGNTVKVTRRSKVGVCPGAPRRRGSYVWLDMSIHRVSYVSPCPRGWAGIAEHGEATVAPPQERNRACCPECNSRAGVSNQSRFYVGIGR
jgi:hypothetical protein